MDCTRGLVGCCVVLLGASGAGAQDESLARYFGFEPPRTVVIDDDAGPMLEADFNGDGLTDLAVVNNRKSRIELHLQRETPLSDAELPALSGPNELPPSPYFERKDVSVAHRVGAIAAADMNGDGRLDLVYAGRPGELVVMAQQEDGTFDRIARRRERMLATTRQSLAIADVAGDSAPEILAIVGGRVHVYPYANRTFAEPIQLGSGASDDQLVAIMVEDFNGDGLTDLVAVSPEHALPLRVWLQGALGASGKRGPRELGAELRFEMPALREVEPVRLPYQSAASIAVIERATRRLVLYDLAPALMTEGRLAAETRPERHAWPGAADRARPTAVADLDGDGRLDLVAADPTGNATLLFRQRQGEGLGRAERFSTFKNPSAIAIGNWEDGAGLGVFVLSEDEQAIGVSRYEDGELLFPSPIALETSGAAPVAMGWMELESGPGLAVVVRDRRDYSLEIHTPQGEATVVALSNVRRAPGAILAADVDGDGHPDVMLLTPGEPMTLVLSDETGRPARVLSSSDMPQFGLVQAAGPGNTALLDVTEDGAAELLIADQNFVRACAYDRETGWRVERQVSAPDAQTALTGLAVFDSVRAGRLIGATGPVVAASDSGSGAVLLFGTAPESKSWSLLHRIDVAGERPAQLFAGSFSGSGAPELLSVDNAGFSVIRLTGTGATLELVDAFRADNENRLEHEIAVGDVNGDGFADLIVLDARNQMCQVFTLSADRKLHFATEFKVFQTRLFQSGEGATYQPSSVIVGDLTGDGAPDVALLVHDRVLIYPQMTAPE